MIDEIRIDHILQIAPSVIRQEDIDDLGARVGFVGDDAVILGLDDVRMRRE